ncbi:MAG: hypothetical protein KVP17_001752 [Porospora cf. gigantea B]|uniref:uncharacterized protein n=1 Tax=Porospora cf. gigantea B TaxID=2853592 RepID=UPI003571A19F|nr:MAG: hypothetical protein KVP17_001752 [Porospora cf. gigantea B]
MSSYNTSDLTDEHPRVDHIVLNRRFDASCDSEDTRVGAFARQYLRAGPCCPVPEEVTVVARLVAAHLLRPAAPGRLQVSGHSGQQHEFALLARFTVGRNVSCLAFRLVESKTLPAKSFDSLYLAFNWFKPEGLSDYVRLGSSLLWNNSVVSDAVLGSLYEDLSSKFLANSEFLLFLKSRLSAFHMNAQGLDRTCTYLHICGFSLGAGVAFGLAYKLRQMSPHLRIRVTGFGPTKIGSWKLRKWCEANLDPASLSVILATSETPALQTQTSLIGCRATACKRPERIQL